MFTCDFDWVGPFWGAEPGVDEHHTCTNDEGHDGNHRCECGESCVATTGSERP